jgi:hypothetical protein
MPLAARAILPYLALVATLGKLFGRLARPPEEVRADNLKLWRESLGGCAPIAQLEPRQKCRAAGVVQNIRIDPREGRGSIEATIIDGTGEMVARWIGRSSLAGIRLGVGLIVEGTVATGREGEPVILNPEYQLVPGPEHG